MITRMPTAMPYRSGLPAGPRRAVLAMDFLPYRRVHSASQACHHMTLATLIDVATATGLLLAALTPGTDDYMRWTLVTMAGAMFGGGAAFYLNPDPDDRRKVVGRALCAVFAGVIGPRILFYIGPQLSDPVAHPVACYLGGVAQFLTTDLFLLFGSALGCGLLGYVMSPPLVKYLFRHGADALVHYDDKEDNTKP